MTEYSTIDACFKELHPCLMEYAAIICNAPLPQNERGGLALLVAAHFFGVAAGAMDKNITSDAREVAELIIATMQRKSH